MSVTIAMPRMSTDPELTTAQSKYVESLARAGAEVHWVELSDPDAAAARQQESVAGQRFGCGGIRVGKLYPVYLGTGPGQTFHIF